MCRITGRCNGHRALRWPVPLTGRSVMPPEMTPEGADIFQVLQGEQLNIVAFVMDYVEIHFNGPLLRAYSGPVAITKSGRHRFPELGSRDALCSLIGQDVAQIEFEEEKGLSLTFESGDQMLILFDYVDTPWEQLQWYPDQTRSNPYEW
jgi:hypothetical protein